MITTNCITKHQVILVALLLCATLCSAQELHHHMLSAQGASTKLKSGHYVSQTIGQQSSVGNASSTKFSAIQGFQQSAWAKLIAATMLREVQTVTVYPNPFMETVNFQFSVSLTGEVVVQLFNVAGQLVRTRTVKIANNGLQLQLPLLSRGVYLVRLQNKGSTYYTKIIKN